MSNDWQDLSRTTDVLTVKPNWVQSLKGTFSNNVEVTQFPGTATDIYNVSDNIGNRLEYKFTNMDKADEYELITFFCEHQGRLKRFWLPYWKNQFVLLDNLSTGDTTIDVTNVNFNLIDRGYERLFFYLVDGSFISRQILFAIDNGTYETLYLQTALTQDIAMADVLFFGRLFLVRFDDDTMPHNFIADDTSEYGISFIELPNEYSVEVES